MKFAERLEEKRCELRLTKKDMAAKIGVSSVTYSLYVNGKMNPRPESVESIAQKLGVTYEWLTGMDDKFNQTEGIHTYADLISVLLSMIASDSIGGFAMDEVGSIDGRAGIRITSYDPNLSSFFQCYETFKGLHEVGNITNSTFENMIDSLVNALDRKAEA